jgi:hypothetical protein
MLETQGYRESWCEGTEATSTMLQFRKTGVEEFCKLYVLHVTGKGKSALLATKYEHGEALDPVLAPLNEAGLEIAIRLVINQ